MPKIVVPVLDKARFMRMHIFHSIVQINNNYNWLCCRFPQMADELPYFKVVQTIEHGEPRLAAVPRSWETNGKLMWPPKSKQNKAMKNPTLQPGTAADGWQEFDCTVKRTYIPSYGAAVNEVKQMSENSDTASDVDNVGFPAMMIQSINRNNKDRPAARKNSPSFNADSTRSNFNTVRVSWEIIFRFCINYVFRFSDDH